MKIQCQSCQAKYTIADEKVLGKVVKIRCKKCSSTIVINGNETQPAEDNADTHVFDYASHGAAGDPWTVNVADGDQRTMTPQEIVAEYKAGVVNDETYCWKDGMADWLPLREIDQLYGMIKLGPSPALEDAPQSMPNPAGMGAGAAAPLFAASEVASAVDSPFSAGHSNGNGPSANGGALFGGGGGVEAAHAAPAAARRATARGAGQDLFGNVEKAGGEDDVMTSAASGGIAAAGGAGAAASGPEKMTGQRNENSVLFSLSALTSDTKKAPENRTTATSDGSGLIDIRALSANMGSGDEKKDTNARVDDIMNLSGGGAFGAALAAPILAPPPLETADLAALAGGGAAPKQNKMMMFAILGAGAFIAIAIVLAVVLTRGPSTTAATSPSATTSAAGPDSTGALAMNDPASTGTPTATATSTGNEPPPPSVGNADKPATVNPGAKSAPSKPAGGGGGAAAAAEPPPKPAEPAKPASFGDALAAAAGKPKEAAQPSGGGGGSTAPFDRGAAAAALGGINVQSCKKPDGPTGSGRVEVTFNPDGSAASANIIEGPFPGTSVGGCIAGKFRGARVPAFGGAPVHVKKSFTIN